jgi:hypothetical protein
VRLKTRLSALEKAVGAKAECCPCPKQIIIVDIGESVPPEYLRPCPVNCPCHRNGVSILEIRQHEPREDGPLPFQEVV